MKDYFDNPFVVALLAFVLGVFSVIASDTAFASPPVAVAVYDDLPPPNTACERSLNFTRSALSELDRMRYGISISRYNEARNIIDACMNLAKSSCGEPKNINYPLSKNDIRECQEIETYERFWEYEDFIAEYFHGYEHTAVYDNGGNYIAYFMIPVDEFNPDRFEYLLKFDVGEQTEGRVYIRRGSVHDHGSPYTNGRFVCKNRLRPHQLISDLRVKLEVEQYRAGKSGDVQMDYAYCRAYSDVPFKIVIRTVSSNDSP